VASRDMTLRLRNDLYCVEWGVKLYSLTHSRDMTQGQQDKGHVKYTSKIAATQY